MVDCAPGVVAVSTEGVEEGDFPKVDTKGDFPIVDTKGDFPIVDTKGDFPIVDTKSDFPTVEIVGGNFPTVVIAGGDFPTVEAAVELVSCSVDAVAADSVVAALLLCKPGRTVDCVKVGIVE
jgi:hypothetical protein